jgi:hypothetical protein
VHSIEMFPEGAPLPAEAFVAPLDGIAEPG